jgi:threonine synthase
VNPEAVPWTSGLALRCEACDWTASPIFLWSGCERCGQPLRTTYTGTHRLPIASAALTDLGLRATPLIRWRSQPATYLKLESLNPTGSHKDRFHAVTSAIGRLAGANGVVTTSTGNHGVACAAHAARDGLGCIVFATGAYPRALAAQIRAYGGEVVFLEPEHRLSRICALTAEGWLPATASDARLSGVGNPYGADGYSAIADEIVGQLGALPGIVCVPVASGDLFAATARRFRELRDGDRPALIVACQPSDASPLAASLSADRPVSIDRHESLARSTSDASSGRLALAAIQDDCALVTVSETAIADATRRLAASGFYAETSSALALAGVEEARARGLADEDTTAVAIITATGRGWNEEAPELFSSPGRTSVGSSSWPTSGEEPFRAFEQPLWTERGTGSG